MGKKDTFFPPHDNRVKMVFTWGGDFATGGLTNFIRIELTIGTETYSTTATPNELFLEGNNTLVLDIGDSTALLDGSYVPKIVGYSALYDDGFLLSGSCKLKLPTAIKVCRQT